MTFDLDGSKIDMEPCSSWTMQIAHMLDKMGLNVFEPDWELIICSLRLGVKPYACSMCDRRFFQRYHLQRHSLTHTGMGRLSLQICAVTPDYSYMQFSTVANVFPLSSFRLSFHPSKI